MKDYKFHSYCAVKVRDNEVVYPHLSRTVRLPKQNITTVAVASAGLGAAHVTVAGRRDVQTTVSIIRTDGTVTRFERVREPAAEVVAAFDIHGYKVKA